MSEHAFVLMLGANALLALLYMTVNLVRKQDARAVLIKTFIMLWCPVGGVVFLVFGWIYFHIFFREKVDLEGVIFSKERVKTYHKADYEEERNIVPFDDAMALTDKQHARELMLKIVRADNINSLNTIARGLSSDDSEVSHYSASVIQDAMNRLRNSLQRNKDELHRLQKEEHIPENNRMIISAARDILETLVPAFHQKLFHGDEYEQSLDLLEECASVLAEHEVLYSDDIETVARIFLKAERYERAKPWITLEQQRYPHALAAYNLAMEYAYDIGDRDAYFAVVNELKQTDIPLDHDTLERIRILNGRQAQ
ncbi:MAG: hypothetical protein VZT48_11875 [Bulleidia sp.]|nr:hypothetical protein [Bulleidia sp.]